MRRHEFGPIRTRMRKNTNLFERVCARCGTAITAVMAHRLDRPSDELKFAPDTRSDDCDIESVRSTVES